MNLARLLQMSPAEMGTRAQQAFSQRWSRPSACRLMPSTARPGFPDLPTYSPSEAEKLCQHRFDLLGYQNLDFGNPIDWHYDPVHSKRAPRIPWYKIPFLDFDRIGDHKIIWELNRHQYLVTLAQAGFHDEVHAQWTHWQTENPYPIGINWASTLEVAFRALSWLWLRHLMGDFHPGLVSAIHLHGWHIERYLSTYYSPNTHLLGEGVALFAIGTLCPEISDASRWLARGWQIVLQQAQAQVRPDGFHFEQSVYYHIYARDFFDFARTLAKRNDVAVPPAFVRTIEKMNEAVAILSQAGRLPNFGDDDGGRVLMRQSSASGNSGSAALTAAGLYTMGSGDSKLYIDAGPQGAFAAGHGHADALSIQLIANGRPVLIDPGTYCYVCPERDRFRGTAAHNTLQIDRRDQAQPNGPFSWTNLPETKVDLWHTTETFDLFAAHHNGYHPLIHQRWVFGLKSKFWLVRDVITRQTEPQQTEPRQTEPRPSGSVHHLDIRWHFLNEHDLTILPVAGHTWTQSIESSDWSPVYGQKESAKVLRFSTETALPAEFAVLLIRGEPGAFTQTGPGNYHYKEPQGLHELTFAPAFTYRAITPDGVTEFAL